MTEDYSRPSPEQPANSDFSSKQLMADGGFGTQTSYSWSDIFPFGAPYPNQEKGIKKTIKVGKKNGYTVVEGACGTGKTLMALTAGIKLVRDSDTDYERVVALTNVKQQIPAFEEDLKTINEAARDGTLPITPVEGVSLVGKMDVCPYSQGGTFEDGEVYSRCNPLRETTRDMVHGDKDGGSPTANKRNPVAAAMGLVSHAKTETNEPAVVDGTASPFSKRPNELAGSEFCPYFAQYLGDQIADEESIPTNNRLLTRDRLMREAVDYGTCPHTTMRDAMETAEVVIGNYQHGFAPQTIDTFSDPIVDESTFLIVDEAHMLIEDIRELLSSNTTHTTLKEGAEECFDAVRWLTHGSDGSRSIATAILSETEVSQPDIEHLGDFLEDFADYVSSRVKQHLDDKHPNESPPYFEIDETEVPLRSPDTPRTDDVIRWAQDNGYPTELWERAEEIGEAVADIKSAVKRDKEGKTGNGTKYAKAAGSLLTEWHEADNTQHYREIRIVDRGTLNDEFRGWKQTLKAEIWINNCIPASEIATQLDQYGGGILMSATLAPLDVYIGNTGLQYLTDRPTEKAVFGLNFPEENRESVAVDLPSFTWSNRHDPFNPPDESNDEYDLEHIQQVRDQYLTSMVEVCKTTPGNVLICLPSYKEAEWAKEELEPRINKGILRDKSSSNVVTTELKEEFFAGEPQVLVTSLRGTLTEGVDYSGDKLSAAVVVGVPIISLADDRTKALLAAYEDEFGDHVGFRYAFAVPAVRKARQALGRVIRGADDVGVRVLLDERYTSTSSARNKVRSICPDEVAAEYQSIYPNELRETLETFWQTR
jgi:DNA excision repair protein ERCC-2